MELKEGLFVTNAGLLGPCTEFNIPPLAAFIFQTEAAVCSAAACSGASQNGKSLQSHVCLRPYFRNTVLHTVTSGCKALAKKPNALEQVGRTEFSQSPYAVFPWLYEGQDSTHSLDRSAHSLSVEVALRTALPEPF